MRVSRVFRRTVLVCAAAVIAAFTAFAGWSSSQQYSGTLESVLKQLDIQAGDFHSLTAELERTKVTVVVNDKSTESGKIFVRRDDKMRIELTQPDPRTTLQGEESLDNRKVVLLELLPKSDDVRNQLSKIQLWIDESTWLPAQQKFFETGSGDYFIIQYKNIARNVRIPDSEFKPHWPHGTTRVKPQG